MGSREPTDEGDPPFLNNPIVQYLSKTFEKYPDPSGDCASRVVKAAGMGLSMGIFYNMVAVPWQPDPIEHLPKGATVFRDNWKLFRSGFARPMAYFSTVAMTFSGVECLFESIRDPEGKAKHWNSAAGGFASGMVMASVSRRLDYALCAGLANMIFMGSLQFSGMHYTQDPQQIAMKVGGKWNRQYEESKELTALKEKYPEYKDL